MPYPISSVTALEYVKMLPIGPGRPRKYMRHERRIARISLHPKITGIDVAHLKFVLENVRFGHQLDVQAMKAGEVADDFGKVVVNREFGNVAKVLDGRRQESRLSEEASVSRVEGLGAADEGGQDRRGRLSVVFVGSVGAHVAALV